MKCYLNYLILFSVCIYSTAIARSNKNAVPISALCFIQNTGQVIDQQGMTRADIDYKLENPGMSIFLGNGRLYYQWYQDAEVDNKIPKRDESPVHTYRMDVILLGSNSHARITEEDPIPQVYHYYLPQCSGGSTAKAYSRITYHNIYDNIDWVLYTTAKGLKYEFVVHPGGNAADIRMQYKGAAALALKEGALTATTPMGSITENAPYSYELATGRRLSSAFVLTGDRLSFSVQPAKGSYVIDPALQWATYFGGAGNDFSGTTACDTAGNVIIAGNTSSTSNIATSGGHQATINGNYDGFVAKFSKTGALLWATYYGGSANEAVQDAAININGDIFIAGSTNSNNVIATSGAHLTTYNSLYTNAFLAKLNSNGARQWGTYYYGIAYAVACDTAGDIILGGSANSTTGVATVGSHMDTHPFPGPPAQEAGYIAKFSSGGSRQWGTYYPSKISFLECDDSNNIIAGGTTTAATGIGTTGSYQAVRPGLDDIFIAKFNNAGVRQWGTYYGSTGLERLTSIACDVFGNVYLGGHTDNATGGFSTTGSFQYVATGVQPSFFAKFTPSGSRLWGTYFYDKNYIAGLAVGPDGNLYLSGNTLATIGTTTGAHQQVNAGSYDLFLASFDHTGSRLYTTYYGGPLPEANQTEIGTPLICSPNGKIYFSGNTGSVSGVATNGAFKTTHSGGGEGLVVQFDADRAVYIKKPTHHFHYCKGDSLIVHYGVTQAFNSANVFTLQLSDAGGSFAIPTILASSTSAGAGVFRTIIPTGISDGTVYRMRIAGSSPLLYSLDNGIDIGIFTTPPTAHATSNAPICAGQMLTLNVASIFTGATYTWQGPNNFIKNSPNTSIINIGMAAAGQYIVSSNNNGCIRKDTITVIIEASPANVTATSNSPVCVGSPLHLQANSSTPGLTYSWIGPAFTSALPNPVIPNTQPADSGSYIVQLTLRNCTVIDTAHVVIRLVDTPSVTITAVPGVEVRPGTLIAFRAHVQNGGPAPKYQWKRNGINEPGQIFVSWHTDQLIPGDIVTVEVESDDTCVSSKFVTGGPLYITLPASVDDYTVRSSAYVYPNPNTGNFTIDGITAITQLEVFNSIGQLVHVERPPFAEDKLEIMTGLPPGLYSLKLHSPSGIQILRFCILK